MTTPIMKKDKKIHFLHIPKTGGTTLNYFLDKQFKMPDICPFSFLGIGPPWGNQERILKRLPDEQMRQYHLFQGHLGWVPRTIFSDDEIETITFLRDPLSKILSLYNYLRGNLIFWTDQPKRWPSIDDFVFDDTLGLNLHANAQTKFFCSDLFFQKYLSSTPFTQYVAGTAGIVTQVEIEQSPEQLLQLAIERLHRCNFVGLTEKYDESFQWLCIQYGWLYPKTIPKQNSSTKFVTKGDLSSKTRDRIIEFNQLDQALYEEAKKIFADRTKTRIHYSYTELENTISKQIAKKEIKFSFEDTNFGEAWHTREGTPPNVFCWSSAPRCTLIFSLKKRSDLTLSFRVLHWLSTDFTQHLCLSVNSQPIPLTHHEHTEGGLIFEGLIPANVFRNDNSLLELVFSIPKIIRPIDIDPNALDIRELGFACTEVHMKPVSLQVALRIWLKKIYSSYRKLKKNFCTMHRRE